MHRERRGADGVARTLDRERKIKAALCWDGQGVLQRGHWGTAVLLYHCVLALSLGAVPTEAVFTHHTTAMH